MSLKRSVRSYGSFNGNSIQKMDINFKFYDCRNKKSILETVNMLYAQGLKY